ncbi:MAG: ArsR family transcriptional regulator [Solirubrobacteraceae bacterium]
MPLFDLSQPTVSHHLKRLVWSALSQSTPYRAGAAWLK